MAAVFGDVQALEEWVWGLIENHGLWNSDRSRYWRLNDTIYYYMIDLLHAEEVKN